ncbi:hypothetical protein [Faecalimonas sp.]
MEIVTGYRGKPHVSSEKWADLNRGIIGTEEYALDVGRMFESELVSNNLLKIYDGCGVFQGREFSTSAGKSDEITIENGMQGEKRIDLIVARYTKNEDTKIETIEPVLIKGASSVSDPVVPKHTEGNIRQGDLIADMPLYEVELNGINVVEVRPLFQVLMNMNKINKYLLQLSDGLKCNGTVTKIQNIANNTPTKVTIQEDGWYYVRALNSNVSGSCQAYMLDSNNAEYLSGNAAPNSQYVRATTAPIYLEKGSVVYCKSFHTDNGALFRLN